MRSENITERWQQERVEKNFPGLPQQLSRRNIAGTHSDFQGFIGTSPVMLDLYDKILIAADASATVFITGESGTGKNVCAMAIHHYGSRRDRPFIHFDCTAPVSDLCGRGGAIEDAKGGTLFLDGVCEMDGEMQKNLLRFLLEEKNRHEYEAGSDSSIRLICATHRDPLQEVTSGRFRDDLFYRLFIIPIQMPPLRHRGDDIIDIAQYLLLGYAAEEGKAFKGITSDAEQILRSYVWPGNIRQLQNTIRNAVIMHDGVALTAKMLSLLPLPGQESLRSAPVWQKPASDVAASVQPLQLVERTAIERAIRVCDGNIQLAAELLQVSPSTLYRKKSIWDGPGHSRNSQ